MSSVQTARAEAGALFLRPSSLLFIYGIIPLVAVFLAVDGLFFDLGFSRSLPVDPHSMQWFNMFFMLPHIFASAFTFFDADYIAHYRQRLQVSLLVIVITLMLVFGLRLIAPFMLFISVYTVYHLVSQQTGIAAMLAGASSWIYTAWKWFTFSVSAILYLAAIIGSGPFASILTLAFPGFVLLYFLNTWAAARQAKTRVAYYYTWANAVMIVVTYGLYLARLPFFMILIPRFVHDVTAFFFYITHNHNRNAARPANVIAGLGQKLSLPEYVYTPLLGIACTAVVTLIFKEYMIYLLSFMALFHYYWEGVMWKRGTPHRQFIHFRQGSA